MRIERERERIGRGDKRGKEEKRGWKEGKEGEGERVGTYRERKRKRKGGVKKKREWQNDERVNGHNL